MICPANHYSGNSACLPYKILTSIGWTIAIILIREGSIFCRVTMRLSNCTRGPNATRKGRVAHTFYQSLAKIVDFFGVVGTKGSGNGGPIVHPTFQLELTNHFVAIGFGTTLCHLITSDGRLVQIMHKVDCQLDQEVSLRLIVVWVIQPIIKVRLRSEPKHGMRSILHPKGLLPLFHDNGTKGNA